MGNKSFAEAWNFGPDQGGGFTVADVLCMLNQQWQTMRWHVTEKPQHHESTLLYLDSTKARTQLDWQPMWDINTSLGYTAAWYRAWIETGQIISRQQLTDYVNASAATKAGWTQP